MFFIFLLLLHNEPYIVYFLVVGEAAGVGMVTLGWSVVSFGSSDCLLLFTTRHGSASKCKVRKILVKHSDPGGNKVQKSYFSIKVKVKVTMPLILMSTE